MSEKYHFKAIEALPDEPLANLEWAMILHRKGEYHKAAGFYRKALTALEGNYLPHSLLADCLLRTGKLKEAVEQWKLAEHRSNHTGIDFAIHAIYGELSPHYRHEEIWKAVEGGDTAQMATMLALAANWNRDWWNTSVNQQFLRQDLEKAKQMLGESNPAYAELLLYAETYLREEVTAEWLKSQLKECGFILGDGSKLPESHIVTDRLLALVMEHRLASADELLKMHGKALDLKAQNVDPAGTTSLNTLAALILATEKPDPEALSKISKTGWERHRDPRFAASLLAGFIRDEKTSQFAEMLPQALLDFPEHEVLCSLAIQHAIQSDTLSTDDIVRAIKAQYRHLSVGLAIRDSYRLKALFAMLEENLKDK